VLAPEVLLRHDGRPLAQRNTQFVKTLLEADAVIIAGQAASHCVKSSIEDLLGEILTTDAKLARKVYILRDCMSAVAVPDTTRPGAFLFDFTPQAEAALQKFADAGMHVVSSTDAVVDWPGINY
jgi:nicotinamidase-related amidase